MGGLEDRGLVSPSSVWIEEGRGGGTGLRWPSTIPELWLRSHGGDRGVSDEVVEEDTQTGSENWSGQVCNDTAWASQAVVALTCTPSHYEDCRAPCSTFH